MFCPDCGNDCGTARFCSACGREMLPEGDNFVEGEILGTYQGLNGTIEVDFCTVTVHIHNRAGSKQVTFLYDEIVFVDFSRSFGEKLGYLSIRDEKHETVITSELDAAGDDLSILFDESSNEQFTAVFRYLSQLTRKRAQDHRGPKQWKPLFVRNFSACPRCESKKIRRYHRLRSPGNKYSSYIQVFECLKCELKMEW